LGLKKGYLMKILGTICARGGSKGVPNKNIRELAGKPLIAYTIEYLNNWGNFLLPSLELFPYCLQ